MSTGTFIFILYLLVAYLLYLPARRLVVNSRISHLVLFGIMVVVSCVALTLLLAWGSSARLNHERQTQRTTVGSRIAQAGGWEALRRDCLSLMGVHGDNFFSWDRRDSKALPTTIAALKPMSVEYYPSKFELNNGRLPDSPSVQVVRIRVFGMHSTGGHSTPYFGLEVVSGPGAATYKPRPSRGGVSGNCHRSYTPVTDGIYEIY